MIVNVLFFSSTAVFARMLYVSNRIESSSDMSRSNAINCEISRSNVNNNETHIVQ